jgi:hypothetical protein
MVARTFAAGLFACACLFLAAPAAAEALESQYSSLRDCETLDRLKLPSRTLEKGASTGIFRCKGVGGFIVYVVDEDPRSFLVVEREKTLFSLEKPMVGDFKLGDFPNVAGAKMAEWRLDSHGRPAGLIVRVSYQRSGSGAAASALFVFDLRGEPVLLGSTDTNEEARSLIDAAVSAGAR